MELKLKRLLSKLETFSTEDNIVDNWDFNNIDCKTQKIHNLTLSTIIKNGLLNNNLDVIITSPEIATTFDDSDNFIMICPEDTYNPKRFLDTPRDFSPVYFMVDGDRRIALVIITGLSCNRDEVILTNSYCDEISVIKIHGLPKISLLEHYKYERK